MIQQEDKFHYLKKLRSSFCVILRFVLRCSAIIALFFPLSVFAANLYLLPSSQTVYQGETFIVEVRINTEGENINTVDASLSFPPELLEAKDFSTGNSILTLWVKEPAINQGSGTVSFTGAIPGGYSGRLPGDPGKNNLLGKIIFKVREDIERASGEEAKIEFRGGLQVLLNDGFGTPAQLSTQGAVLNILTADNKSSVSQNEWREEIEKDATPPEPFKIELSRDPSVFEGKYFIIFSTTDKQTGVDHYEILVASDKGQELGNWKVTESPYLLDDQNFKGIIKVKAVDKAGNERIESIELPIKAESAKFGWQLLSVPGAGILILSASILLIKKFYFNRRKKK